MSNKKLIQNNYKVRVEGDEEGEYKVSINENNPYYITIEDINEGKASLWRMIAITVAVLILIAGLSFFFCKKLDSLNDKAVTLQEQVENNAKEKLEIFESGNVKLKELEKQNDDLNRGLLELQDSNKVLKAKLDTIISTSQKSNAQVSKNKQINTKEEYYLIERPNVPATNQKIPVIPPIQEVPATPSIDLEIPEVPSLN